MFGENFRYVDPTDGKEKDYTVRVMVNSNAVEDGEAGFVIDAYYREREHLFGEPGEWSTPVRIVVSGEWDPEDRSIIFRQGEREIGRLSIGDALHNEGMRAAEEVPEEDEVLAGPVEALLEAMPVPDPIFGCLLKGAVTSATGQLFRCWNSTSFEMPLRERRRTTLRCMRANGLRVIVKFAIRSGRCMMGLGIV